MWSRKRSPFRQACANRSLPFDVIIGTYRHAVILGYGAVSFLFCSWYFIPHPAVMLLSIFVAVIIPLYITLEAFMKGVLPRQPPVRSVVARWYLIAFVGGAIASLLPYIAIAMMASTGSENTANPYSIWSNVYTTVSMAFTVLTFALVLMSACLYMLAIPSVVHLLWAIFWAKNDVLRLRGLGYRNFTLLECTEYVYLCRSHKIPLIPADQLVALPGVENNAICLIDVVNRLGKERL